MSIYSGFPTRKNESSYMNALYNMNVLLASRVLMSLEASYAGEEYQNEPNRDSFELSQHNDTQINPLSFKA